VHKSEAFRIGRPETRTGNFPSGVILRAIIGASLLLIVLRGVDLAKVLRVLQDINIVYFIVTLLLLLLDRVLMAYKWNLLTKVKGVTLSAWQSFRIYLMSGFFGIFLPTGIGGDIYRIYHTSKREGQTEEIAASVFLERFLGIIACALLATFGLTMMLEISPETPPWLGTTGIYASMVCILVVSLMAFWLSLQDVTLSIVRGVRDRWRENWLLNKWIRCHYAYVQYRRHKGILVLFLVLSVAEQSVVAIANYAAAKSMGLNIGLVYFIGIIPIIHIATRIPISINAIGVQEGVYMLLFTGLGVSTTEAFTLALVVRIARWLVLVPGGMLYVTDGGTEKKRAGANTLAREMQEDNKLVRNVAVGPAVCESRDPLLRVRK